MIDKTNMVDLKACFMNMIFLTQKIRLKEQPMKLSTCIKKLDDEFRNSVKVALSMNIDIRDYDDARFAICALIDEQLMVTKWRYQTNWREHLFQKKYYGTANAGSEYYERLLKIRPNSEAVREVYILCLVYGFTGRYSKSSEKEQLEKLRADEFTKLQDQFYHRETNKRKIDTPVVRSDIREDLFGFTPDMNTFRIKGSRWCLALAVFITMYIIFSVILNFQFTNATEISRLGR